MAIARKLVPVAVDHHGEVFIRFQPLPLERGPRVVKKLPGPGFFGMVPELAKALFEDGGPWTKPREAIRIKSCQILSYVKTHKTLVQQRVHAISYSNLPTRFGEDPIFWRNASYIPVRKPNGPADMNGPAILRKQQVRRMSEKTDGFTANRRTAAWDTSLS